MATPSYRVGFDLGGTKMLAVVFDASFKAVASERKKTKGNQGVDAGLARLADTINAALSSAGLTRKDLSGVGVGCPGPLDLDKGIMLDAPNLGWTNVPLKAFLEKTFGCPAAIANDVDAGTYGEYRFGAARKARCALGVFPGTGIGAGCIYEGRIFRGKTGSCMELGHFPVDPQGAVVGPDRYGTLEAQASRLAIAAQALQAIYRGQAPVLQKVAGTKLTDIRSKALVESIKGGDKVIEDIVRRAAYQLGTTIAGAVNLLAPDVLVLGGGLVEAMSDLYLSEVKKAVNHFAMPAFANALHIAPAELGDHAGVMGAAALVAD